MQTHRRGAHPPVPPAGQIARSAGRCSVVRPSRFSPLQRSISAFLGLLCASALHPVSAGETTVTTRKTKTEVRSVENLFVGRPTERISIQEVVRLALTHNLDVRFENAGIGIERSRVSFAAGAFDPVFSISTSYQSLRRLENVNDVRSSDILDRRDAISSNLAIAQQTFDQTNTIRLAQNLPPLPESQRPSLSRDFNTEGLSTTIFDTQRFTNEASLVGRTPWGMRYGFEFQANRYRNTFSGDIRQVIPEYETVAQLTVVQPLLKNFGPNANLAELRLARVNREIQVLEWKQRVNSTVQAALAAYYDMTFALRNIRVREDAVAAGQKLVDLYKRRVELGFNSPIDIRQAEVQVSADREQLIVAKNVFLERQFDLKRLVVDKYNVQDARIFVPENVPLLDAPKLNRVELLLQAFERRLDYQQALLTAEAQEVRVRFARNQLLPQLDLVASYGLNGLGTSFGDSFEQGFKGRTPSWSVGINFSVPLGNVQPRAQYRVALGQKEQALLRIRQAEVTVGSDVDQIIARIETNRQRVATAVQTVQLAQETMQVAYRRLEEGLISSFDILEFQRRLYEARSGELSAQADLSKSVTQLWLVTSTTAEKAGVAFKVPVKP
ncbi:MAG: TolC family protein [Verrucomicrobiaceae bacterium]|nr:MAG: TolC family protein [Verrucomicrobiaceae bacterium]